MGAGEGEAGKPGTGGGQREVGAGQAPVEEEGAGGKGGGQGEPKLKGPRADPFNQAEYDRVGTLVVDDVVEVLEVRAEETGRMAVGGGQRQAAAPNVPAAAMKSILPEVQGKGDGKGGKGRQGGGGTGESGATWAKGGEGDKNRREGRSGCTRSQENHSDLRGGGK